MAARAVLWAASLGLRRMGVVQNRINDYERAFELGDEAPAADKGLIAPMGMR